MQVVLKMYHKIPAVNSGLHEFNMLWHCKGAPSVVKVYQAMHNITGTYIILSIEDLTSYKTLVSRGRHKLFCKDALLLARNCCRAIAELHQIKVSHGDVSSENILYNNEYDVKLIDFDCAQFIDKNGTVGGNADFIS